MRNSTTTRQASALHRRERGQVLPLFALGLVALLALTGLGLDGARVYLERREAQGAADLAALSAARFLPADATAATNEAIAVAALNGFTITAEDVTTPYQGQAGQIKVDIPTGVSMFFTPVLGIFDTDVNASAAAVHEEAVVGAEGVPWAGPAILAYDNVCDQNDTLKWDAHDTTINGDVVTNSGGDINGSNNVMNGGETWYTTASCTSSLFIDPAQNPDPDFQPVTDLTYYPLDATSPPFDNPVTNGLCDYMMIVDEIPVDAGSTPPNQIADGIYCRVETVDATSLAFHKKLVVKTAGSWCDNCTFIADLIQSSAADTSFEPELSVTDDGSGTWCRMSTGNTCGGYPIFTYSPGLDKDGINFSGTNQHFDGLMFSPYGTTHYTGHDAQVYDGAIWSRVVEIIGSGFQLNGPSEWAFEGAGLSSSPEVLALME